jgi:hypothetical protein
MYLFLLLLSTKLAMADPQVVPLNKGDEAPFSGVLLNNAAAAASIVSSEEAEERCQIKIDTELDLLVARHTRDTEILNAKLNFCEDTKTELLLLKDEYIVTLEKQVTKKRISPEAVFGLGIVAGVGVTIGAGYALGQVSTTFR